MTTSQINIESEITNGATNDENLSFDSNQISSDEQLSQIIDSINLSTTCDDTNTDESQSKSSSTTTRTAGQTTIGAKLVKKLETLGIFSTKNFFSPINDFSLAANSKENKQTNGKTPSPPTTTTTIATNVTSSTTNNESESRRNLTKVASMLKLFITKKQSQLIYSYRKYYKKFK
jgi:hypothetical protein